MRRDAAIAGLRVGSWRARPWREQALSDEDFECWTHAAEGLKRLPRT